jgi:hypothetical protein
MVQALFMKASGQTENHMVLASYFLMMGHTIMVLLIRDLFMVKEDSSLAQGCIIKGKCGTMLHREKGFVLIKLTIILIMDNG